VTYLATSLKLAKFSVTERTAGSFCQQAVHFVCRKHVCVSGSKLMKKLVNKISS